MTALLDVRRLALVAAALAGVAALVWSLDLSRIETLLLAFVGAGLADVAGIWWNERIEARRARDLPSGLLKLIGSAGYVREACRPDGTVRVGLEEWPSRAAGGRHIPPGQRVVVLDVESHVLIVERSPGDLDRL
jgi:membrane-bound ClpP family serine protease